MPVMDGTVRQAKRTERLTPAQAHALIDAAGQHLQPLATFLLATGARTGEALRLDWQDVNLQHAKVRLRETKNGHDRPVPPIPRAVAALASIHGRTGRVFRK